MDYLRTIIIPSRNTVLYGKAVNKMVALGMKIREDGIVKGKFHYVTGYYGFNCSEKEEQEGYFFPFLLPNTGYTMEFIKNGVSRKGEITFESYNVFRVTDKDVFEVKVDGKTIAKLDFSQALFEEKKGRNRMFSDFFDTGVCGVPMIAHIGSITKEAGTQKVVFKNKLPYNVRLVNVIAVPTREIESNNIISVGNGINESAYINVGQLTAGKTLTQEQGLSIPTDTNLVAKLGTALTDGNIDIFTTVVRLDV